MSASGKPFVSVCTPTYNRRHFIPLLIKCYQDQTYPSELMEWIVIDDGTDAVGDLLLTVGKYEVWGRRYFSNYWAGNTVYFVTRMDAIFGNEIIDLKVSLKSKDPVTRLDSHQWPLYCQAAHCRKFTYIDVQLRRVAATAALPFCTHFITVAAKSLTLYLSDSICRDLKFAVSAYLDFV